MAKSFVISLSNFVGLFDLDKTLDSEQCPSDIWFQEDKGYKTFFKINNKFFKVFLEPKRKKILGKTFTASRKITDRDLNKIRKLLLKQFTASYNLLDFYRKFEKDAYIRATIKSCHGLRLMQDWDLEWRFIEALYTQNISVSQIRKIDGLIRRCFGEKISFPDGDSFYFYPDSKILSTVSEGKLKVECKLGYRANYVSNAAKLLAEKKINFQTLKNLPTNEARKQLIEIKGFGPKVADIFLVYGLLKKDAFPMDVWLKRALEREYFQGKKQSEGKLRDFAISYFKNHAAIAHLYMFLYERKKRQEQLSMLK